MLRFATGVRFLRTAQRQRVGKLFYGASSSAAPVPMETGDLLMAGLSRSGGVSVKVVNCKAIVQEQLLRNNMSPTAASALGELTVCGLMMGTGLKGQETLQINLVGTQGLKNVMVITDGECRIRGTVGNPAFEPSEDTNAAGVLLGEGQVQVVRNHPTWNRPGNGITAMSGGISIPLNLALYMAESEQRNGVMLADVLVTGNLCRHAIGILVERLPDCGEYEIEASIKNLEGIEKTGLWKYLNRTDNERSSEAASDEGPIFRSFEPVLGRILDDSLTGLGEQLRYTKNPTFKCTCGIDRVWRALRLLPKDEIRDIVNEGEEVSMKCEFCGESYGLSCTEIKTEILDALQ